MMKWKSWAPRMMQVDSVPGGWRSAMLALAVHAVFFGVLVFGMHWKRFLPPADDGVMWVLPQTNDVSSEPDKSDAENAAPATTSVAKPEPVDVKLATTGATEADGAPAKPAAQPKSKQAEAAPPEEKSAEPETEQRDTVSDKKALNDLKIRIATNTPFAVTSLMRETNVPVEFTMSVAPDGTIAELQLVRPSDNPEYDEAVRQGIIASQPFPHGVVIQGPTLDITMRPIEIDFVHRFPGRSLP